VKAVDQIAPYVRDRGCDWEVTIDEVPADLWSLQGEISSPFESHVEKRWVKENQASPYSLQESCRSEPSSRRESQKSPLAKAAAIARSIPQ
jgi:hypothetical protein